MLSTSIRVRSVAVPYHNGYSQRAITVVFDEVEDGDVSWLDRIQMTIIRWLMSFVTVVRVWHHWHITQTISDTQPPSFEMRYNYDLATQNPW